MKRIFRPMLTVALMLCAAMPATAQTDISEDNPYDCTTLIKNPDFEENDAENWTCTNLKAQTNSDFTMKSGNTYLEKWVSSSSTVGSGSVVQEVTDIPVGRYKLVVGAMNYSQSSTSKKCTGAYIYAGSEKTTVYTPADYSVTFDCISGKVEIGFKAVNATGNWIAVDNFRLYKIGELDVETLTTYLATLLTDAQTVQSQKMNTAAADSLAAAVTTASALTSSTDAAAISSAIDALNAAIAVANASATAYASLDKAIATAEAAYVADQAGAADFRAAIDKAQEVSNAHTATNEEVEQAIAELDEASLVYNIQTPTGAVPTVTTFPYMARGCKLALGRSTVKTNGASLSESGFCFSTENKEPTILDSRSTFYYEHSGKIFCITDLHPATTYYMRAYALTKGYQVAYGDVIKVVTLPEATCTWSWTRNDATDAEDARCQAAVKEAIEDYNLCSGIKGFHLTANYVKGAGAGSGTADCSYGGWMRISQTEAYQRTGTVQHETNHGLGVGTTARWYNCADLRANTTRGYWLGRRANELVNFFENNTAGDIHVTGDATHMWATSASGSTSGLLNYGINGAQEDSGSKLLYYANALLTEYLCEDGLCPTYSYYNGLPCYTYDYDETKKYYMVSESASCGLNESGFLGLQGGSSTVMWKPAAQQVSDSVAWYIEYLPTEGYYRFRNAATGQYLCHLTASRVSMTPAVNANTTYVKFQLLPGRVDVSVGTDDVTPYETYGYWLTWALDGANRSIQASTLNAKRGYGTPTGADFDFSNAATNQRWIIISEDDLETYRTAANAVATSITTATAEQPTREAIGIYTTTGLRINALQRGINIVRYNDGTAEKVIVK